MKKFTLILLLTVNSFAFLSAQGIKPAPSGKAVVYFVRVSALAFAINFTYFDSNMVIGKFNSQNYMRYECDPGEHLFWVRSENEDYITANLDAGKVYFVEAVPSMGMLYAQVFLHPIDPKDKRMEKLEKVIDKFTPQTMSEEEKQKETKNLENIIVKALNKYKEELAKGKKKFKRLENTMYYDK